jgi:hypothetical protein
MVRLLEEGKKHLELIEEVNLIGENITFIDMISENTFLLSIFPEDDLRIFQRGSRSKIIKDIKLLHTNGAL